jgi:hypothetical protein
MACLFGIVIGVVILFLVGITGAVLGMGLGYLAVWILRHNHDR